MYIQILKHTDTKFDYHLYINQIFEAEHIDINKWSIIELDINPSEYYVVTDEDFEGMLILKTDCKIVEDGEIYGE